MLNSYDNERLYPYTKASRMARLAKILKTREAEASALAAVNARKADEKAFKTALAKTLNEMNDHLCLSSGYPGVTFETPFGFFTASALGSGDYIPHRDTVDGIYSWLPEAIEKLGFKVVGYPKFRY